MVQANAQSGPIEFMALVAWVRDRHWLSTDTLQRRLRVDRGMAEHIIRGLVLAGALHPQPEGTAYRVRYPQVRRLALWWGVAS